METWLSRGIFKAHYFYPRALSLENNLSPKRHLHLSALALSWLYRSRTLLREKIKWCNNSSKASFMGNKTQIPAGLSQCKLRVIFSACFPSKWKIIPKKISKNEALFTFHIISNFYIVRGITRELLFMSSKIIFFSLFLTFCITCCVSPIRYCFCINTSFIVIRQENL